LTFPPSPLSGSSAVKVITADEIDASAVSWSEDWEGENGALQ